MEPGNDVRLYPADEKSRLRARVEKLEVTIANCELAIKLIEARLDRINLEERLNKLEAFMRSSRFIKFGAVTD